LRELRRSLFGAELAARLFEEEELRALDALEWRRVAADPDLTEEQRAEELAALEADWPEAERARIERVTLAQRVIARESAMREDGAAESEIQTQREQEFGAEAASRLAALDRARAEWTARVERYRAERARLEADPPVDEVEGAEALEALRARYFEGPELIRIRALDELEARRPTDS
jgi:lipase chaperone LimK